MGTTRLQFTDTTKKPTKLVATGGVQEIEVEAGESHYHIHMLEETELPVELFFHLHHPKSQLLVTGLVAAKGESAPSLKITTYHHAPRTRAETLIRTVARDKTQPRFEGRIKIVKKAQEVESYLNHHSLLLGEYAKSWTLPSLEIEADQVKCSHAATIRTITDLDLFYLRSRGIKEVTARETLIQAFIADVFY
jgi:Fe-S cluster assembly protein SufD